MKDKSNQEKKYTVLGISFIPLGWNGDVSQGMPSVYMGQLGIAESGMTPHYVCFTTDNKDFEINGIHCHYIRLMTKHNNRNSLVYYISDRFYWYEIWIRSLILIRKYIKQLNPDLLVSHGRYSAPAVSLLGRKYGICTVYREYGMTTMYQALSNPFLKFLMKPQFCAIRKPFDLYVLTDDGTRGREVAVREGVDSKKILFLKNGLFNIVNTVDLKLFGENRICSAGRLSPEKYFDVIIKALSIVASQKEVHLYIVGDGPDRKRLEKLSYDEGVSRLVHFVGTKSRDEVFQYYQACDISICLGSINPLIESMASGVPVITLDLGATGDLVDRESGIKIPNPDPRELAEAVIKLLFNKKLRENFSKAGFKKIHNTILPWKQRIAIEVNAYISLIGRKK